MANAHPIPVRRMSFSFSDVPRHWFGGSALATHLVNGLNLVFPDGERFFIRSVRHYEGRIDDDELRARIRGFYGQEAAHGREHDHAIAMLERQGYDVAPFLSWYRHLAYEVIEPMFPPSVRLAATAAAEHFTATLAERALSLDFLDEAHPTMRELLRWHASEEIEHKAVAFDVFERVDGRYAVRVAGLVIAGALLALFWARATRMLVAQEPAPTRRGLGAERAAMRARGHDFSFFRRAVASYLSPGFHPDHIDNRELAERYLASIGRATA